MFRHPLVRSPSTPRQGRHADGPRTGRWPRRPTGSRPDRRAWHLAAATAGPTMRSRRSSSARRAVRRRRGGFSAAAAFRERALAVTADPARRSARALAAAETCVQAGLFDAARGLLSTAEAGTLDELQRAQVELLHGQIALFSTLAGDALPLLMTAARHLERVGRGTRARHVPGRVGCGAVRRASEQVGRPSRGLASCEVRTTTRRPDAPIRSAAGQPGDLDYRGPRGSGTAARGSNANVY
jgi:hypothetical protein